MSNPPITPEDRFAKVVEAFRASPGVTAPSDVPQSKKFGSSHELRINNKIFAMLSKGRLVVKLPRQRVDALVGSGDGERFDPGHGRLMKEWLAVLPTSEVEWLTLTGEAMEFVASKG